MRDLKALPQNSSRPMRAGRRSSQPWMQLKPDQESLDGIKHSSSTGLYPGDIQQQHHLLAPEERSNARSSGLNSTRNAQDQGSLHRKFSFGQKASSSEILRTTSQTTDQSKSSNVGSSSSSNNLDWGNGRFPGDDDGLEDFQNIPSQDGNSDGGSSEESQPEAVLCESSTK